MSDKLPSGQRCYLTGLQSLPELNGVAVLVECWHEESGRYAVQFADCERQGIRVRRDNLSPVLYSVRNSTCTEPTPIDTNGADQGSSSPIVELDVGGTLVKTRQWTLTNNSDYFNAMFNRWGDSDAAAKEDTCIFIDRDPALFQILLRYWRQGVAPIPEDLNQKAQLLEEAIYYGCHSLENTLLMSMNGRKAVSVVEFFVIRRGCSDFGNGETLVVRAYCDRGTNLGDVIGPTLASRFVRGDHAHWDDEQYGGVIEINETAITSATNFDGTFFEASFAQSCEAYENVGGLKGFNSWHRASPAGFISTPALISAAEAHGWRLVSSSFQHSESMRLARMPKGKEEERRPIEQSHTRILLRKELPNITPEDKLAMLELPGVCADESLWTKEDEKELKIDIEKCRKVRLSNTTPIWMNMGGIRFSTSNDGPGKLDDSKFEVKLKEATRLAKLARLSLRSYQAKLKAMKKAGKSY